jgi:tRNA A37 threonylcarbamoyltransferase TsaD
MAELVLGIETSCDETSAAVLRRSSTVVELLVLRIL